MNTQIFHEIFEDKNSKLEVKYLAKDQWITGFSLTIPLSGILINFIDIEEEEISVKFQPACRE